VLNQTQEPIQDQEPSLSGHIIGGYSAATETVKNIAQNPLSRKNTGLFFAGFMGGPVLSTGVRLLGAKLAPDLVNWKMTSEAMGGSFETALLILFKDQLIKSAGDQIFTFCATALTAGGAAYLNGARSPEVIAGTGLLAATVLSPALSPLLSAAGNLLHDFGEKVGLFKESTPNKPGVKLVTKPAQVEARATVEEKKVGFSQENPARIMPQIIPLSNPGFMPKPTSKNTEFSPNITAATPIDESEDAVITSGLESLVDNLSGWNASDQVLEEVYKLALANPRLSLEGLLVVAKAKLIAGDNLEMVNQEFELLFKQKLQSVGKELFLENEFEQGHILKIKPIDALPLLQCFLFDDVIKASNETQGVLEAIPFAIERYRNQVKGLFEKDKMDSENYAKLELIEKFELYNTSLRPLISSLLSGADRNFTIEPLSEDEVRNIWEAKIQYLSNLREQLPPVFKKINA
jgi:hypothetical protein